MLRAASISSTQTREATAQSLAGFMLWALVAAIWPPGWSPALLTFGPLVLYPLIFAMLDHERARRFSVVAFLPALASYGFDQGSVAGALTLPWLLFALAFFWHTARAGGGAGKPGRVVMLVVAANLIVGAGWLVLARLGERPLDYAHAIVHATAVHFHYAGFVLPILALQWLRDRPSIHRYLVLAGVLTGVPMVAAGITLSAFGIHWPELIAVWFFVAVCGWFAVTQLEHAQDQADRIIRWLLVVSSLSLILAMTLAFLYATGNYWRLEWLDIPLMLRTHGPIQVFGFALPCVIAWTMREHGKKM